MIESENKAQGLSPIQAAEIARRESQPIILEAINLVIKDESQMAHAAELLAQVKTISKNVKGQKDPIVKGLKETLKGINDLFKPTEQGLSDAESAIKKAILDYQAKQAAKAAKKAERIEAKVDAGKLTMEKGTEKIEAIKQPEKVVKTESGSVQMRTIKKIRITSVESLPAEYFLRDSVIEAIRVELARDVLRGGRPCPTGAEVYEEQTVAGGTR